MNHFFVHAIIYITLTTSLNANDLIDGKGKIAYGSQEGDLILGGLFPIHEFDVNERCGAIRETEISLQLMEAMIYAIKKINNRSDLLPGIRLGFNIRDTCSRDTVALEQSLSILAYYGQALEGISTVSSSVSANLSQCTKEIIQANNQHIIAGLIGPGSSRESVLVSNLLDIFHIPQISYSSTSDDLSKKLRYPYFLRTVPRDYLQVRAIIDLCLHYNWSYVQFVYSEGSYGENGFKNFRFLIQHNTSICVAGEYELEQSAGETRYDTVMTSILSKSSASKTVVILFCNWGEMVKLFQAADRARARGKIVFIGSDEWTTNTNSMKSSNYVAQGSLYYQLHGQFESGFDDYFTNLTPYNTNSIENPWFNESWQYHFNCNLPPANSNVCDPNLKWTDLPGGFTQGRKIIYVLNAVDAYAHAINDMHKDLCDGLPGLCSAMKPINGTLLVQYLLNVNFTSSADKKQLVQFDANGDITEGAYDIDNLQIKQDGYISKTVGTWTLNDLLLHEIHIQWPINTSIDIPISECSKPCGNGQFEITREEACCWTCTFCARKQYFNRSQIRCINCSRGFWPNGDRSKCVKVSITHYKFTDLFSIILFILMSIGACFVLFLIMIYIKFNQHPIVKASGRELCYCIILSSLIISLNCVTPIPQPTVVLCSWSRISIGLSFSLCYGALLVKTTRVYRIFHLYNKGSSTRIPFTSRKSQVVMVSIIVLIRLMVVTIWMILQPPQVQSMEYDDGQIIRLSCKNTTSGIAIFVSVDGVVMLGCTIFAYLSRHVPENYNETRYINFSMYAVVIVWSAFIPAYFTTNSTIQPAIFAIAAFISVKVTLLSLFVPKLIGIFSNNLVEIMNANNVSIKHVTSSGTAVFSQSDGRSTTVIR